MRHSKGKEREKVGRGRRLIIFVELQDSRAAAFDYWRSLFTEVPTATEGAELLRVGGSVMSAAPLVCQVAKALPSLEGRKLTVDFLPQMLEYDRGCDLELWQLWAA